MKDKHWRRLFSLILITMSLLLLFLLWADTASAQGIVTPLDCLPTLDGMAPYAIAPDLPFDTSAASLSAMSGRSIWLGYDNGGWDMPADARVVLIIIPMAGLGRYGDHRWIMGYMSESEPDTLWLMANAKARYNIRGHYGYHPCGHAAIDLRPARLERS